MTTTFDPANKSSRITLSGGNLVATTDGTGNYAVVESTTYKSTGKWYCEFTITVGGTSPLVGLSNGSESLDVALGSTTDAYSYRGISGNKSHGSAVAYGSTFTTGDVISMLFDADVGTLAFWKNGVDQGTAYTGITGSWTPSACGFNVAATITVNFGDTSWAYTPTTGFTGLNSPPPPDPTIGDAAVTLERLTAVGYRQAAGAVTLPALTAVGGYNGIGNAVMESLQIAGSGGTRTGVVVLEVMTGAGTGRSENRGEPALEALTAAATGHDQPIWTAALTAPAPTLSCDVTAGEASTFAGRAPAPNLASILVPQSIITVALSASHPRLASILYAGTISTISVEAPAPTVAITGCPQGLITVALTVPVPRVLSILGTTILSAYRTWVLNTRKGALTEYNNFEFNSFTVFNNQVIAVGASGIVILGTQDQDGSTAITARVRTGKDSFASSFLKRVPRIYLGHEAGGDLIFRTITTEGGTRSYMLRWNHISGVQQRRIPVGKGPKSRYFQFEIENVNGADFGINDVLVYPTTLRRRVQ